MPSPFPGMDPYLENSARFPDFHHEMISAIRANLNRQILPKYVASVEERVYISEEDDPGRRYIIPDVEIKQVQRAKPFKKLPVTVTPAGIEVAEPIVAVTLIDNEIHDPYISIIDVLDKRVVTVIEILSPTNKCRGSTGREMYMRKRREVLSSEVHLVEIDLLREGVSAFGRDQLPPHHYAVHLSKAESRPEGRFWPILLHQRLPVIDIPLRDGDDDASVDLQSALSESYDRAGYRAMIDYRKPPSPPLPEDVSNWAAALVAK